MRALFMDFPNDAAAKTLGDEYMFGPALFVAPVTEQGVTSRRVYLPAGTDWYDLWTDKRHTGGQWIDAAAPIDRIPVSYAPDRSCRSGAGAKHRPRAGAGQGPRLSGAGRALHAVRRRRDDQRLAHGGRTQRDIGVGRCRGQLSVEGRLPTGQALDPLVMVIRAVAALRA